MGASVPGFEIGAARSSRWRPSLRRSSVSRTGVAVLIVVGLVGGVGRAAARTSPATSGHSLQAARPQTRTDATKSALATSAGLVAAFAFDEGSGTTVTDASGTGNNGTTANTTWAAGKNGGALSFNGTSSRVTIPDSASLHLTTAMTLEAWVDKTATNAGWRDVIYKGDDNYYLSASSASNNRPAGGGIIGGTYSEAYATATPATNTWVHLALTYDGSAVRLFVNGAQVASTATTGNIATSTNPLSIGSDPIYGQYFQGLIDDVRVYNVALSAAQIQTDMNTPVSQSPTDTQAPTAPGALTANAANTTRVDLSWTASTDNVGVTGYRIERCQGAGCSNFAQIAAPTGTGTTYSDTSAVASTTYNYRVRAADAAGNLGGYSPTATATTPATGDTQAPTAPATASATAINSGRIDVSWAGSTDNVAVTGYLIERCQGSGCSNFAQVGTISGTGTSFTDSTVAPSTSYGYRVRATDAAGNLSGYSPTATATTPAAADTQAPTAPATLNATGIDTARIDLSWTASTDNVAVTGYLIERCQGSGCTNFTQIAAPAGTGTTFSDTGLSTSTTYRYRVRATDAAGNFGGYSPIASAATAAAPDTQPPSAPTSLSASAATGRVDLTWSAASDNVAVTGYLIERCQGSGCSNFAQIAAPTGTGTTYADTNVAANTSYTYRVRATDAAGNLGGYGPTASATTPQATGPSPVLAFSFNAGSGTTATDSSGNGNTGTLANTTWALGKFGNALSFNGGNSVVSVPDAASLHLTSAMTLEAWVESTGSNTSWTDLIYKGDDNYYLSGSSWPNNVPAAGETLARGPAQVFGASVLPLNAWVHLAVTYDGSTMRLYVNGTEVSSTPATGNLVTSANPLTIGGDSIYGQYFRGLIDEVRVYNLALTPAQIQSDMATPIPGGGGIVDTQPPTVTISAPAAGASVADTVNVSANASDDMGVAGVTFFVDGVAAGPEDVSAPYAFSWDTHLLANGTHTLTAQARDQAGNVSLSAPVTVNVANSGVFQNEILATQFTLPTSFAFLPDGRMLVAQMPGTVKVLPPPYTTPDATPFLTLSNISPVNTVNGDINGLMNIVVDPNFATNHYFYVNYTSGSPYRNRISRFTANAAVNGTVPGSELILYQDTTTAGADHHGGAIMFGNDGKLYLTTGDEVNVPSDAQNLSSGHGKVLRLNPDGTVPTDNPFYDGSGPNFDAIWAYGLRNPFRAFYDSPTGRMFIGDVGGNVWSTATEHIDLGAAGANYGWPNCESNCASPPYTNGIYNYAHNGLEAAVVAGFIYRGSQFPSSYQGSFFFGDYAQNWIKRATLDANGNVTGVFNFVPTDGSINGPLVGNVTDLQEGPDGAMYYLDIGFDDVTDNVVTPKIRRIRYVQANLPPVAAAAADQTQGPVPFTVNFSSAGSSDPEGQPLTYSWDFGDGSTSSAANPQHTYTAAGRYTVRLSVSDGNTSTLASPFTITAGSPPVPTILTPADGSTFRGGDVISFSGSATDAEDGTLPPSAFTWEMDMLHGTHVHPGLPVSGISNGTFTIPTSGHDFSGNVRYKLSLTVTDSNGISTTTSVIIWPQKVNVTFNSAPQGLSLTVNGLPATTPFVHDDLIGFNDVVQAPNQTLASTNYTFSSWSDGGAQQHTIVVPSTDQTYTATYTAPPPAPAFVQVAASTPQQKQTTVATAFPQAQSVGDLNVVVIGLDNATSNIVSVTDSAGNLYQAAAPIKRSATNSQAIYYAKNIQPSAFNTVTVTLSASTPFVDVRVAEYSGLDLTNPLDVTASGSGKSTAPNSGAAATTKPVELLVGGGTTTGAFTAAGSGFTKRIITTADGDILEDRVVSATGSYSATGTTNNANWVMQLATFRGAGQ